MPRHRLDPHSDPVRCLLRMASWWTVVLILQIGALWEYTGATSCTTDDTCYSSLHVAGTCTSGVCDCESGLVSTRTGCIGEVMPKIDVLPKLGPSTTDSYATMSIGSGEVLVGKDIKLVCNPNYGDGTFVWTKDNTPLTDKINSELILTSVITANTGDYRCKIKFTTGDFETAFSAPVKVSVIDGVATNFAIAPQVVGMPARAFAGATLNLKCVNIPSGLTLTYQWFVGGAVALGSSGDSLSVATPSTATKYKCVISTTDTIKPTGLPATSAEVTSPTIASAIAGVFLSNMDPSNPPADPNGPRPDVPPIAYAEAGSTVTVFCAINDTDLIVSASDITNYVWKKNGSPITGKNTVSFTTNSLSDSDNGAYTCSATVKGVVYTSKSVQLVVEPKLIERVTIDVYPTKPVLGGFVYMYCLVRTTDPRRVTYTWKKGGNTLFNITDEALQINGLTAADNGVYSCEARVGLDSDSNTYTLNAKNLTTETPVVTSDCENDLFGVGNTYTLTCGEDYDFPYLTYRWYIGGSKVPDKTSLNYEITVKPGTTKYTCDITLGSDISKTSSDLTVVAKQMIDIVVNVGPVELDSAQQYQPVTGTNATLTCLATTADGASGAPTYKWEKGATLLSSTSGLTVAVTATVDGVYKCTATMGDETLTVTVNVAHSDNIQTPTINTTADTYDADSKESYSEGADYELTCETASYSPDMQYVWTKNSVTVGTSRVYKITNANKTPATGDSGTYICTVKLGAKSATSAAKSITIGAKGQPCQYTDDCDGEEFRSVCEKTAVCVLLATHKRETHVLDKE
ncbi:protein sidekick-2-like [Physella acuta]|uniref:protein sidekick-2-like n=1 Tax=Physella acuta TaxID=109671 RepID=UPI0027DB0274|nr:protein sidekick-2-like [Physella acuta]